MGDQLLIEQIQALEQELSTTKYNKRTEHAIGLLKVKIARLKEQLESRRTIRKQAQRPSYAVKRNGDATVALIGFPSVGKSTLINKLTNANSKIASYNFTTLNCIPGLMEYKNAKIQILDLPGILEGAADGTGKGKETISVLRNADLILLLADAYAVEAQLPVLRKEIYSARIRLNQKKPDVKIDKKARGGVTISSTVKLTKIKKDEIVSALKEFRIMNADVIVRDNINISQFIDSITGNRKYASGLFVINKIDIVGQQEISRVKKYMAELSKKSVVLKDKSGVNYVMISAEKGINLELLKEAIYQKLKFIRIYLREVGKEADLDKPMIMREGAAIRDVCSKIHTSFVEKLRFARVWGKSAKFPGQKFKLEHVLKDGDIVQLHLK
ncbi:GTP-binding protein [Candidatus Woesearchaeota archaeon CG07_land_8_20_14_0_80_44_23]|nr:MAG: GTP-binding protein [Candidatus Woesearchaeota archaeon CG07_land_8_20_14_0_80_44_23]